MDEQIKQKIESLKNHVLGGDNESAHIVYDEILEIIVSNLRPDILQQIKDITKDTGFWFA